MNNSDPCRDLTSVETEVLGLLKQGMNTSEIAKKLSMSYHSVADINQSIKRKLHLTSFRQLTRPAGEES